MKSAVVKVLVFAAGGALLGAGLSWWGDATGSAVPHGLVQTAAVWAGLASYFGVLYAAATASANRAQVDGVGPLSAYRWKWRRRRHPLMR